MKNTKKKHEICAEEKHDRESVEWKSRKSVKIEIDFFSLHLEVVKLGRSRSALTRETISNKEEDQNKYLSNDQATFSTLLALLFFFCFVVAMIVKRSESFEFVETLGKMCQ